jgi:small subunit ribosomal protein S8
MSQDILADALNQMMNAKKARKTSVTVKIHSKLLVSVLALAKLKGYVKSYSKTPTGFLIEFGKLNGCNAIKPRFIVNADDYEKYSKRYLPSKDLGILIVSTSHGLMIHQTADEKKIGGSLLAYFF